MCGIAGFTNTKSIKPKEILSGMMAAISHRGPDSQGAFFDSQISLGINRLKIIDPQGGKQPVFNEDKSIVVIFNGEIYNYKNLRKHLTEKGHKFHSKSDTEVIVHLYEEYRESFLEKLNGMFAIALYDINKKKLILARDRFGVKPLYYFTDGNFLAFSSELKSLTKHPVANCEIDKDAFEIFQTIGYLPRTMTIFKKIKKLLPGRVLIFQTGRLEIKKFWETNTTPTENYSLEKLDKLIDESVRLQMVSDRPLGAFLSGGIDSGILVHYLSKYTQVRSFSVSFKDLKFDESDYAGIIAKKYNTIHKIIPYDAKILTDEFPEIVTRLDEPLADPSLFPSYHLCKEAKKDIKVALSGDGGDELFEGYPIHQAEHFVSMFSKVPKNFDKIFTRLSPFFPISFGSYSKSDAYSLFFDSFRLSKPVRQVLWSSRIVYPAKPLKWQILPLGELDNQENPLIDTYLTDNLLAKMDRASMLNSVEVRVPFLDNKIFTYALSTKGHSNMFNTKIHLRKLAVGFLPAEIVNRKKKGFGIPLDDWIRNELKNLVGQNLESKKDKQLFDKHLGQKGDYSRYLWAKVIFNSWRRSFYQ